MATLKMRLLADTITKGPERKSITKKALSTIFAMFVAIVASTILFAILQYNVGDFIVRLFYKWQLSLEVYLTKSSNVGIAASFFLYF